MKFDYDTILAAIDSCDEREKQICQDYIILNPDDKDRIERIRDIFLFATYMVRQELETMLKKGAAHA